MSKAEIDAIVNEWLQVKDRGRAMNILVEIVAGCLNGIPSLDVEEFYEKLGKRQIQ